MIKLYKIILLINLDFCLFVAIDRGPFFLQKKKEIKNLDYFLTPTSTRFSLSINFPY